MIKSHTPSPAVIMIGAKIKETSLHDNKAAVTGKCKNQYNVRKRNHARSTITIQHENEKKNDKGPSGVSNHETPSFNNGSEDVQMDIYNYPR